MHSSEFLKTHNAGLGLLLGIEIVSADPRCVVAQATVRETSGPVGSGLLTAVADSASAYGATLGLAAGFRSQTCETKTSLLGPGDGTLIRADASLLHLTDTHSIWRASVFRGSEQVADVTQTQIASAAGRSGGSDAGAAMGGALSPSKARELVSKTFSDDLVQDRLAQIFEAACVVVGERGFAKASIRHIAEQAEMPVATMYQYVERKDDLLRMIYDFFAGQISDEIARVEAQRLPPRAALERLIHQIVRLFDQHERSIKIMFQETRALSPEDRRKVFAREVKHVSAIAGFLRRGIADAGWSIREPELAAHFIWFLCSIWPLRHWALRQYGRNAVSAGIVDFALRGLGIAREDDASLELAARE